MPTYANSIILSAVICLVALIPATAIAELKVLEGEHTVIYDIVNPRGVAFIPDYTNESFSQKVINQDEFSKRVQVTSRMLPLKTRIPFPIPSSLVPANYRQYLAAEKDRQSNDASIVSKAREITAGSRYAHEAANSILAWIADTLTFDSSITVPADAVSAFKYRKAYCVGYSNLAVAMLRAAGIPARVAHGYLPPGYEWGFSKEYWGVKVNDGGFHAYLEIFYPDSGWVFSDAEHSQHFVDPFHVILRLDGMEMPGAYKGGFLDVDKATFYTIFKEEDRTVMVDELPLPKQKRLGRRLDEKQHTALISGQVTSSAGEPISKGTAVLWKDGRGTQHPFSEGKYVVAIAMAGKYRLELRGSGFAKSSHTVDIEQGKVYRKDFILAPGGVIKGKVTGSNGKPVEEGDVFYRDGATSFGIPIDQDGTFRIEGLTPGDYRLSVTVGERTVIHQVSVAAGKETVQDFIIP